MLENSSQTTTIDFRKPQLMAGTIAIGQRVHCILYGGKDGIVYNVHGDQRPETVKVHGGFLHTGGNAEFDIVWDNGTVSARTPESIIHGVQWRIYDELATPEEIIKALEFVQAETTRKEIMATEQKNRDNELHASLKAEYTYLVEKPGSGGKGAAKNIRIELKRHWPKIKFSVTSSYDKVDIYWTDGPTGKQVEEVVNKYEAGHFDGMDDCYHYSTSVFINLFGGVKYVFTRRETSDELFKRALELLKARYPGNIDKDANYTFEDWKSGKLYNISMNMSGEAYRDNVQSFINSITCLLPGTGYEYKHKITKTGDTYNLHCYDYRDGKWRDYEEVALEHCVSRIEWNFWR